MLLAWSSFQRFYSAKRKYCSWNKASFDYYLLQILLVLWSGTQFIAELYYKIHAFARSSNGDVILFQLPDTLPGIPPSNDEPPIVAKQESSDDVSVSFFKRFHRI